MTKASNSSPTNPFRVVATIHGACVVPIKDPLCPHCLSDETIDCWIDFLKYSLDQIRAEMKNEAMKQRVEKKA